MVNRRFATGKTNRHHYAICPYCGDHKKNIQLHYQKYHPENIEEYRGEVGEMFGMRVFISSNTTRTKRERV